jgi:hypothetical protein
MFSNRFAAIIAALFLIIVGFAAPASAQQDRFKSEAECVAAVEAGTAVWYQPSFFDHRNRPPARLVDVSRPLEERACVEMWIVGGWHYVPQAGVPQAGDDAPWFHFDAEGKPIRRSDCGNRVRNITYVPRPARPKQEVRVPLPPGRLEGLKETFDHQNNPLAITAQFQFRINIEGGRTTLSDATGRWSFDNLPPGEYQVEEIPTEGWELLPITPANGVVRVESGKTVGVVFKNRQVLPAAKPAESPKTPIRTPIKPEPYRPSVLTTPREEPTRRRISKKWLWVPVVVAAVGGGIYAATRGRGASQSPRPPKLWEPGFVP